MAKQIPEEKIYEEARKRVKEKRGFWGHFIFYAVVNVICFLVWALGDRGYPWFLWVLGPWGLVIILPHYLRVFIFERRSDIRAVEKEAERIKRSKDSPATLQRVAKPILTWTRFKEVNMSKQIFKVLAALVVVMLVTVFAAVPVLAADLRSGDTVTIASGEVIDDDLYVAATEIIIDGTVNGDIFAVGTTITINGIVNGGVSIAGQTLTVNGTITHGARLAGTNINVNGNIDGDLLAGGTTVNVASTARIGGDFLFGASTVRIDGPVEGYIKGAAGEVTLTNGVGGDIELKVDNLTVASTANLQGDLTYTSDNEANIQSGAQIGGTTTRKIPEARIPAEAAPFFGIGGKVVAFLMTLLAGIVVVLVAPRRAAAVAASVRHRPWLSLGWGAIILFATPIAAIITLVTVVGVPVGLIGLTLYGIGIYLSQIVVGLFIGYWIIGYFRKVETRGILVGALALGFTVLTLLKLIPYVGIPLWLATVLFGLGAMALSEKTLRAEVQQPASS